MTTPAASGPAHHDGHLTADVAIIGLGSAGEALASRLLSEGLSVVGFEPGLVGGECPFTACMPSKALLHDAHRPGTLAVDAWRMAVQRRDDVAEHQNDDGHATPLVDNGLELVRHRATIVGPGQVAADGRTWKAAHVVIAVGGEPMIPPIDGLDPRLIWTSEHALTSPELPRRLVVIGAGAVGSELADIYRNFGSKVTVLEAADRLLPDHDSEVAARYAQLLRASGVDLRLSTKATRVEHARAEHVRVDQVPVEPCGKATVALDDGSTLEADRILVAAGRAPRLGGLGLDSVGLDTDEIPELDDDFVVPTHPWLRLVGDVNGRSPWTHGANREAEIVGAAILGTPWNDVRSVMPHCVFTDPPVAHVGASIETHRANGRHGVRGVGRIGDVARQSTDQLDDGMVVLAIDVETGVVVGGSAVGPLADEMIATITSWVHLEATIEAASRQVFAFPTISQVVEVAATDGLEQWRSATET